MKQATENKKTNLETVSDEPSIIDAQAFKDALRTQVKAAGGVGAFTVQVLAMLS